MTRPMPAVFSDMPLPVGSDGGGGGEFVSLGSAIYTQGTPAGGQGIPWELLFELEYERFAMLPDKASVKITMARRLGWSRPLSATHLFYAQSTAACHYLFMAQGGRYRKQLLDYLAARYTGDTKKLDIQTAFGMSAARLGSHAVEHARRVVSRTR